MPQSQNKYQKLSSGDIIAYSVTNPEKNKTVLLIHGNLSDRQSWNRLIAELSKYEFRILAIDQRGYGESSYLNKLDKIEDLSRDLKEFCEILQLQDLIVCGWSLGGIVALQFISENPHLAKRAVLVGSGHVEGFPLFVSDEEIQQETPSESGVAEEEDRKQRQRRVRSLEEVNEHPKIKYFKQILEKKDKNTFKTICKMSLFNGVYQPSNECVELEEFALSSFKQQNYIEIAYALSNYDITKTNLLENITCPVLIYHGEKDLVIPKHLAFSNAEFIGKDKCKIIVKEEIGHCPPYDSPSDLASEINLFAKED